jgi:S1-C subfamily serine protease
MPRSGFAPDRLTARREGLYRRAMRRIQPAAVLIAIALSSGAVTGCGGVIETIAESVVRGTDVKEPWGRAPVVAVDPPDASLASLPVVAEAARSVVKIRGVATACKKILEGSGVVFLPNRVMTNAHVVAGSDSLTVSVGGEERAANVVSYDPSADIAILDAPGLLAPPLSFAEDTAPTGTDALVLGYPVGGTFVANPARIREVIELTGPDIYRTTSVKREVYVIRGKVGQGDSGGPLIDLNKRVLGIAFGAAVDDPDYTGFVLTAEQVYGQVASAGNAAPVATGACVS